MKIGELAEKTEVSRDTIRLYEKMGILCNVTRPHEYNNYKEYGPENIYRIKMVKQMKSLGLTLNECREIIDALVLNKMKAEDRKAFIKSKVEQVKQKITSLKKIQSFLQERLDNDCAFSSDEMIEKLKGK
jgi:DNA-binding transcriptional MerR regulator